VLNSFLFNYLPGERITGRAFYEPLPGLVAANRVENKKAHPINQMSFKY